MPRLFIISGCNGSGKTTASYALLPELFGCREFVNSDEFAKSLAPFNPESAYVAASRFMLMKMRYLLDRNEDFCIETTLATRSMLKMARLAQEKGYYVTILYLWLNSPDLAVSRVKARVAAGGHNIKEDTIRRRYNLGLHYLFREYMPVCNRWILADNSRDSFEVIAEGSEDGTIVRNSETFARIKDMNFEYEKQLASAARNTSSR
ncbi:MAG: zeta toxin family protein [Bacteroidales bacterium]|nr:zeta toxin family protein [Bacteroidales bacterium]